jgi:hypothetical protein
VKLAGIVSAILLTATIPTALAHGDAEWIQLGRYVDEGGTHCCGPNDCHKDVWHQAKVIAENDETVTVSFDGKTVTLKRYHGWYPSKDDEVWICLRGGYGRLVCAFTPEFGG